MNEWSSFCAKWLNPRWQSSRWLPSSSWVRMNEGSFFLYKMAESKMADFKIATIIKLSQNEWVKYLYVQMLGTNLGKCEWVWEEKLWWLNPRWPEFKFAEYKMAAIIKLSQKEWVKFYCAEWMNPRWPEFKMEEFNLAAIIKLITLNYFESESEWGKSVFEWIWEKITKCLNPRWQCLNPTWQNSRWLPSSSWVSMNDFESDWISWSQSFEQNGWIQDIRIQNGRIQDGCHHQFKSELMSLSQIELVWVRIRVEEECFWVNLREDNKVSEFKMAVSESNLAEFKMAAIIKLSQNEWVWVRLN